MVKVQAQAEVSVLDIRLVDARLILAALTLPLESKQAHKSSTATLNMVHSTVQAK